MDIRCFRPRSNWAFILVLMVMIEVVLGYWPVNTVLQVSVGVSWPIDVPDRKAFTTSAFQVNYNLPWNFNQTIRPPFLPYGRSLDAITGGDSSLLRLMFLPAELLADTSNASSSSTALDDSNNNAVRSARRQPRGVESIPQSRDASYNENVLNVAKYDMDERLRDKGDLSAGELYETFETTLEETGFESNCLLKSVCELARHPLHLPADEENLLAEMLHFVLTPSAHQSFMAHEEHQRTKYEAAEAAGRNGLDCDLEYPACSTSLLDYFTSLEDHDHQEQYNDSINNIDSLRWVRV